LYCFSEEALDRARRWGVQFKGEVSEHSADKSVVTVNQSVTGRRIYFESMSESLNDFRLKTDRDEGISNDRHDVSVVAKRASNIGAEFTKPTPIIQRVLGHGDQLYERCGDQRQEVITAVDIAVQGHRIALQSLCQTSHRERRITSFIDEQERYFSDLVATERSPGSTTCHSETLPTRNGGTSPGDRRYALARWRSHP
jgi:hypothetical protein